MFWIGGRLREVVAHGGSTELTNCLRGFAEHNRYKKICNLWTPLNTRNLHGGNTVHISLKAKIKCYWFDCKRRFWRESEYGKPMGKHMFKWLERNHPYSAPYEKLKTEILYKRNNLSLVLLAWSAVSILSSH